MIGDSTMGTSGGVTTGAIAGAYQRAIPAILEQKFQSAGMLYGGEGFYGTGLGSTDITSPSYVSYNSLMSTVGYFTTFSGVTSVGGYLFYGSSNNTNPFMQWNPSAAFDRLTVYFVLGASLVVAIDGTVIDNLSPGTGSIISKTYNLSLATHNVRLASQNGQYSFPVGAEAWDSTKQKSVLIRGMGWATSTTSQWNDTTNGYGPIGTLPLLKADMHCIMLGINNWRAGAVSSAFTSDIAALATAAKSQGGSVMLIGPPRSNPATVVPDTQQQPYVDALKAYASAQGYDFMDVKDVLGSFATANAAGDMADDLHQTAQGVGKITQAIYARLTS